MIIDPSIERLLYYAETHLLLDELNVVYARNMLLDELKLTEYTEYEIETDAIEEMTSPDAVTEPLVNYAVDKGIITDDQRDYFASKLLNIVMLRPAEVVDTFESQHQRSPQKAFEWLYDYSIKSDYIKSTRIARNKHWEAKGLKGKLEITINLSKPEKSNADTAKLLETKSKDYPLCSICAENIGYSGRGVDRATLRYVPIELGGEEWFWQFSPYSYFNQHGIAVNRVHTPMLVNSDTIVKLFDFVDYCPTYFIGCNAALPRIGGSILSHDHFQGGYKLMPMHKSPDRKKYKSDKFPYINVSVAEWYNNVIRLSSTNRAQLTEFASEIIAAWNEYSDESVGIIAKTSEQHNSVTPIARRTSDGKYMLEIILRNNRADETYPDGIFHAHPQYHNIKSESIGLIEAMGLFILPGRLDKQLTEIESYVTKEVKFSAAKLSDDMKIHQAMIEKLVKETGSSKPSTLEAQLNIKDEINRVCENILKNTAVFKDDEAGTAAFEKFLTTIGLRV